jgi:hypothetical protein
MLAVALRLLWNPTTRPVVRGWGRSRPFRDDIELAVDQSFDGVA